jgi:hypothetical protein
LLGGACATIAYTIGQFVEHLVGKSDVWIRRVQKFRQ